MDDDMRNNREAGELAKAWGEMTPRAFAELEKELAELKRYREREPLVRELFEAVDDEGAGPIYVWRAIQTIRDFKL